jgi:hypothetical protein
MSRKLALKKLKASDLSFFQTHFRRFPEVKQKAFNLDKAVVETRFFPNLEAELDGTDEHRAPVALTLYGPEGAGPHSLMRKILKQQKNWRLNGELVVNPEESPTRYDPLRPEDIAIMEFSGASMPSAVKMVLLSATNPVDAATHAAFTTRFPLASMTVLTEEDIQIAIADANTPMEHPIRDWLEGELLEEIGNGDADAAERLVTRRQGRGLSASELQRAKAHAEKVGRQGEELLDYYLQSSPPFGLTDHEWVANRNAVSPFDFLLRFGSGEVRHVDAKSTGGTFGNSIYLSIGEIMHAVNSGIPYDLYRLYNVTSTSATLRIAENVAPKLSSVVEAIAKLPTGVKAESLAFSPDFFEFGDRDFLVAYPSDESGE